MGWGELPWKTKPDIKSESDKKPIQKENEILQKNSTNKRKANH